MPVEVGPVEAGTTTLEGVGAAETRAIGGVIKWFDVTRGFGFAVADDETVGDILVHFSVLQAHGRRSLPKVRASRRCRFNAAAGSRRARSSRSI